MKKLIIILIFISTFAKAQEYPFNMKQGDVNHLTLSYIISGASSGWLYQETGNKFWSGVGGFVFSTVIGAIKELFFDPKFSMRDMRNNLKGNVAGVFTVRLFIGKSVHKKHLTMEELFQAELYE